MTVAEARCTSGAHQNASFHRPCGRLLEIRPYTEKDGGMSGAAVCPRCDGVEGRFMWMNYRVPKLTTETGWRTWNTELERRLPPKKP